MCLTDMFTSIQVSNHKFLQYIHGMNNYVVWFRFLSYNSSSLLASASTPTAVCRYEAMRWNDFGSMSVWISGIKAKYVFVCCCQAELIVFVCLSFYAYSWEHFVPVHVAPPLCRCGFVSTFCVQICLQDTIPVFISLFCWQQKTSSGSTWFFK